MPLDEVLVDALAGSNTLVATGVDRRLLPAVLRAHERTIEEVAERPGATGDPSETAADQNEVAWQLCVPMPIVEDLGRSFVLGTALATYTESGTIRLATSTASTEGELVERTLFITDGTVYAVAGTDDDRTLVESAEAPVVRELREPARTRLDECASTGVAMPGRDRLYRSARESLCRWVAADLEDALDGLEPGALDRTRTVTDRTLLLALGARHDHLFQDVRTWAESVGIAPRQTFTVDRRMLVAHGLIEEVKVPMGVGHPNYRLRAIDEGLLTLPPERLLAYLRDRLDGVDRDAFDGPDATDRYLGAKRRRRDADRPVWERKRRR